MTSGEAGHRPVLVTEVLDCLRPKAGESYLDLTAGYGGHASAVLGITKRPEKAVLVDRDSEAVDALHKLFAGSGPEIIHQDFFGASSSLAGENRQFDMILADLGVSSLHLNEAKRGFSVGKSGPLDMRMDANQEVDAQFILNNWSQEQIAKVLKDYGEEPKARAIASKIVTGRPIRSTEQLAAIASSVWRGRSKMHPATRTFQAIRIAVNDELNQLEKSLPLWMSILAPGGRLAIISFHSLEDRIVKRFMAEHSGDLYDSEFSILTKKPITAGADELVSNPRARSAKLRACRKNKNKRKDKA